MATLVALSLVAVSATAQTQKYNVPKAEFSGPGEDISTLISSNSGSVEKVYLYNVGTDRFLNAGGYWGTEAASFTVGLPITLTKTTTSGLLSSSTYYTMQVSFANSGGNGEGNTVGWVAQHGNSTSESGYSPAGFYLDRSSTTTDSRFTFTRVTDGFDSDEYVYTVRTNGGTQYYMYDGGTDLPNKLTTAQDNIIYSSTTNPTSQSDDATKKCGLWKIITQTELTDNFANTYDHIESPSDASFLIRGQNFNRMNSFSTFTTGTDAESDKGWYAPSSVTYTCAANTNTMGSTVTTEDAAYGMFYCCAVTKATAGDEIKQRVTCPKQGWYRIDMEGFYHDNTYSYADGADNSSIEPLAEVFGRVYGQDASHPDKLTSVNTYTTLTAMEYLITDEANKITTIKAAGQAFYYDYYPHHLMIYVANDNTDIELGIRFLKTFDNASDGNYVAFDDAELKFLGTEVVMSENDNTINPKEQNNDYKNRLVMFERQMTTGKWNTLTLPFDVTKEALQAAFAFGMDVELAEFDGLSDALNLHFTTINLKECEQRDTVLKKDVCYLVKTSRKPNEETYTSLTDNATTTVEYYYLIERVSFNKQKLAQEISAIKNEGRTDGSHDGSAVYTPTGIEQNKDCRISFRGVYENGHEAPANTYVMSGGDMYFLHNNKAIKGFRGWIEDAHQAGTDAQAARHSFGVTIDGVTDDATQIIGLFDDGSDYNARQSAPTGVYDLSGRLVRQGSTSLDNLPKGLYIVDGRKVVVK